MKVRDREREHVSLYFIHVCMYLFQLYLASKVRPVHHELYILYCRTKSVILTLNLRFTYIHIYIYIVYNYIARAKAREQAVSSKLQSLMFVFMYVFLLNNHTHTQTQTPLTSCKFLPPPCSPLDRIQFICKRTSFDTLGIYYAIIFFI